MIIGLSGKKRSGKDTLASALVAEHGFARLAFADAVRQAALDVNPWLVDPYGRAVRLADIHALFGDWESIKESPVWNQPTRELLQELGSVMALRDNMFWAGPVLAEARERSNAGENIVITDVRFPWETVGVKNVGGLMIRVERSNYRFPVDGHISETMLDDTSVWGPDAHFDTTPLSTLGPRAADLLSALVPITSI